MTEFQSELMSLLSVESFQRWLAGQATPDEDRKWSAWLRENPHHYELYAQALKLWEKAHFRPSSQPDLEQEWQKLLRRLAPQMTEAVSHRRSAFSKLAPPLGGSPRFSRMRFGAMAAAAVLVVVLLGRLFFWPKPSFKDQMETVSTAYGERTHMVLPDSTKVILNANSSLRYPATWTATSARRFELRGEAYFEVASHPEGAQHDFVVHTDDGSVRVVGTRFVVYDRGQGTRVVVERGGVEVAAADTSSQVAISRAKTLLTTGNSVHFHKGARNLTPETVQVGPYTTWWRDQLVLQDTPFEQIVHRLEETYGIQVEVKDENLLKRTLSGTIENRNLEVITEALAKALRVALRRQGQVVIFGN